MRKRTVVRALLTKGGIAVAMQNPPAGAFTAVPVGKPSCPLVDLILVCIDAGDVCMGWTRCSMAA